MLLKGTVRGYNGGAGTAEVELVGSRGVYITVPVATHLDSRAVYAGLRCAVLSWDPHDQADAVLVATYDEGPLMGAGSVDHGSLLGLGDDDHTQYLTTGRHSAISGAPHHAPVTLGTFNNASLNGQELNYSLPDHAHQGASSDGGQIEGVNLKSTGAVAGRVLRADGSAGCSWGTVSVSLVTAFASAPDSTNDSTSSTSFVDTSLSCTINVPATSTLLFLISFKYGVSSSATSTVILTDSSNNQLGYQRETNEGAGAVADGSLVHRLTGVSSGSKTYKMRHKISTSAQTSRFLRGQMLIIAIPE